MKHIVTLSNGERVTLEEGQNELHIGWIGQQTSDDFWVATVSRRGVLVCPNSSNATDELSRGLNGINESQLDYQQVLAALDECVTDDGAVCWKFGIPGLTKRIQQITKIARTAVSRLTK